MSYNTEATGSWICSQALTVAASAGADAPVEAVIAIAPDTIPAAESDKNPFLDSDTSSTDIRMGRDAVACSLCCCVDVAREEPVVRTDSADGTKALTPAVARRPHADVSIAAAIAASVFYNARLCPRTIGTD